MIELDSLVSLFSRPEIEEAAFQPEEVQLTDYFPSTKSPDLEESEVLVEDEGEVKVNGIKPTFPGDRTVLAIDSTGFPLGYVKDGLVIAVRASVVVKPAGSMEHRLELYGPYMAAVTNTSKEAVYSALHAKVFGQKLGSSAPALPKMLDRVRNLVEKYIQLQVATAYDNAILLLDGSLITRTVSSPTAYVERLLEAAYTRGNNIAAISKSTTLTLRSSRRSILSLVEGVVGPTWTEDIRLLISQEKERYKGRIYVTRLTPLGEPFRIDIPDDSPAPHPELMGMVSGLSGDYGYPEELKLAHSTCVLSSLEIMELQAAATAIYGLEMKEDLRKKIFPFG